MTKQYKVNITRIATSSKELVVGAANRKEAMDKAIQLACNTEWTESSSEYEIDTIFPISPI